MPSSKAAADSRVAVKTKPAADPAARAVREQQGGGFASAADGAEGAAGAGADVGQERGHHRSLLPGPSVHPLGRSLRSLARTLPHACPCCAAADCFPSRDPVFRLRSSC